MKTVSLLIGLCLFLGAGPVFCQEHPDDSAAAFPELKGNYLGQKPPGLIPELFAPGIVSAPNHRDRDVTFSGDMSEFYFTRNATIMVMRQENGFWTAPEPVSFSADYFEFEAFVAPDGQHLYYISNRSLSGEGEHEDYQMWMVQREGDRWGKPERVNDKGDFYPTITDDGVMYFTSVDNDLYRTRLVDGLMTVREKLGDSINTTSDEYNSCIAPDESFLIFTSAGWGEGFGGGDLFVSFRKPDGSWGQPRNMGGGINSGALEYCPSITPDGRYLFFASRINGADDIFWVDAGIIDILKSKDLNTADMLFDAVIEGGTDDGMTKYQQLQTDYLDFCIFDGRLLMSVADRFITADRTDAAANLLEKCFVLYPETKTIIQRLKLAAVTGDEGTLKAIKEEITKADMKGSLERAVNVLGYRLMGWGRLDDAVRIFRLNTELFTESFNVFDSYGEALLVQGDTVAAITNYEKSLELNTENENAANVLERLKGN